MIRLLICGPFPAPVGGVSIHTQRLSELLQNNGISVTLCDESREVKEKILNIRSLKIREYLSLVRNTDIIHIHSSVGVFRLIHIAASFLHRKRAFVTIHSWRTGKALSFLWAALLNRTCEKVVFVSNELKARLPLSKLKSEVFPAFIPPQKNHSPLPDEILSFITRARAQNKEILASNAFRIVTHNNQDLYGLDICIEAFLHHEVQEKRALVFVVSDPTINRNKIAYYKSIISKNNLKESILIYCGKIDFYGLLRISDASIRATNTDGDALSIRESIHLGVPCIASDCVDRPAGTILFRNRSVISLTNRILSKKTLSHPSPDIDESKILSFYNNLYQGNR